MTWGTSHEINAELDEALRRTKPELIVPEGWEPTPSTASGDPSDPLRDTELEEWLEVHDRECADKSGAEATPPSVPAGQIDPCTDLHNAKLFAEQHAESLRYCHPMKAWFRWDGRRWAADKVGAAMEAAKQTAKGLLRRAADAMSAVSGSDRDAAAEAKAGLKWAIASQQANRLESMLQLARSDPSLVVLPEQFDADPWLLNVENGTVDLRTGEIRRHNRGDLLTCLAPVQYDPSAESPAWENYLVGVFAGDTALTRFVQRLCGYMLTGDTSVAVFPILHGGGSNGKSLFTETMLALLGDDYAGGAPDDLLTRGETSPASIALLKGKRLVVASETADGCRLNEAMVKKATGSNKLTGRHLYQNFFSFAPTHKFLLETNHKPRIREGGHGTWRRLRLVPFKVKFWSKDKGESGPPDLEADPLLKEKLAADMSAVLTWAVRGSLDWQADGRQLTQPEAVAEATKEYEQDEDLVGQFLAERCERVHRCDVPASVLYPNYVAWMEASGERPKSKKAFGQALLDLGFPKRESNGKTLYRGLKLRIT